MSQSNNKYSDLFVEWLVEEGYTHCFFLAGGNIMHLLDSVRTRMNCVPFVNEIGAAIAVEYFNEIHDSGEGKAFALVTAGPGLTNTITAIASAWMESRELLVIGGQVKSTDLMDGGVRQRGIQEIDGVTLVESICKTTLLIDRPANKDTVINAIRTGSTDRKGPVFLEMCLDVQAAPITEELISEKIVSNVDNGTTTETHFEEIKSLIDQSSRPVILLGGGISRRTVNALKTGLNQLGIPVMTTWNGADRLGSDFDLYFGRPNTWGQRSSNIILQQSDLLIALGTRLGIQQTGFAWEEFIPVGKILQVDIDVAELEKGHPKVDLPVLADANSILEQIVDNVTSQPEWNDWVEFAQKIRKSIPLADPANKTSPGYIKPYEFFADISNIAKKDDLFIPSSSGAAETVAMQAIENRFDQRIVMNKGMASMGYGLSGAIGASLAAQPGQRTFLFEGDGSIAQNLQEFGTVAANNLNLKIFIFANDGYASIRTTQRNYFNGAWIGCDSSTGLGLPNWEQLAKAYGIAFQKIQDDENWVQEVLTNLNSDHPVIFEVPTDPEQTYFPKIMSKVMPDGSMRSNPLHLMSPDISEDLSAQVFKYLDQNKGNNE